MGLFNSRTGLPALFCMLLAAGGTGAGAQAMRDSAAPQRAKPHVVMPSPTGPRVPMPLVPREGLTGIAPLSYADARAAIARTGAPVPTATSGTSELLNILSPNGQLARITHMQSPTNVVFGSAPAATFTTDSAGSGTLFVELSSASFGHGVVLDFLVEGGPKIVVVSGQSAMNSGTLLESVDPEGGHVLVYVQSSATSNRISVGPYMGSSMKFYGVNITLM